MSRCFPYPPPGYSVNDALIESIKLQREKEKAKTERKREKKEKKREKKEKNEKRREKKEKENRNSNTFSCNELAQKLEKSWPSLEGVYKSKSREDNPDQLERSGLTEEYGQPIVSHNPSYSTDSTQNSNKRKRTSTSNGTIDGSRNNGNTFRIRLPLQKHKEPVASASKEELCSTSGRTDLHAQHKHEVAQEATRQRDTCSPPLITGSVVKGLTARPDNALNTTVVGKAEIFTQEKKPTASGSTSSYKAMKRVSKLYTELITNWVPPRVESVLPDSDDQEWLFGGKSQKRDGEKRLKASDDAPCCGSYELQPRACYLPEADIYALPYTIPF